MKNSYDDPHFQPRPTSLEPRLTGTKRGSCRCFSHAMISAGLEHIELRGKRSDTEIIFWFRNKSTRNRRGYRFALWKSEYPTGGAAECGSLHEAASVAGWIYSDWSAGDLEPLAPD